MQPPHRAGDWLRRLVAAPRGQLVLYWYSILEAAFVPIPFEAVLAPYMQVRPDIRWRLAAIGVAGYATVAFLAWCLGALVHEAAATAIIDRFGWREAFDDMRARLAEGGFWVVALAVALPIPTMPVHVAAGATGIPLTYTLGAVVLVRGARYFGTGLLVALFGNRVVHWFRGRRAARRGTQPPR